MNIRIDEKDWQRVLKLIEVTEQTLAHYEWLSSTSRKLTRDDIQLPQLRSALMQARDVKWEPDDVSNDSRTQSTAKRPRRTTT
jgi:hypothetical protein